MAKPRDRRKRQLGSRVSETIRGKKVFAVSKRQYRDLRKPRPNIVQTLQKDRLVEDRRSGRERRSGKKRRR